MSMASGGVYGMGCNHNGSLHRYGEVWGKPRRRSHSDIQGQGIVGGNYARERDYSQNILRQITFAVHLVFS